MPTYAITRTNPVASGDATKKEHFDDVFDGVMALLQGDEPLERIRGEVANAYTSTGTVHNLALTSLVVAPATIAVHVIPCENASALTITGVAGGVNGQRLVIRNDGSSTVKVTHSDSGSTSGNRFSTPSTAGQIIGAGGSMEFVYRSSAWRLMHVLPGAPIVPTFSAGDYTGSGSMTWTVASGDIQAVIYRQWGKFLWFNVYVGTTDVGGVVSTALRRTLFGFTAARGMHGPMMRVADNGVEGSGFALVAAGSTFVEFYKQGIGNWTAAAGTTFIYGAGTEVEIQ